MPSTSEAQHYKTIHKECLFCDVTLILKSNRDIERKLYCSKDCLRKSHATKPGGVIPKFRELRKCNLCGIDYVAVVKKQKYCSQICTGKVANKKSRLKNITFDHHIKRLLIYKGRKNLSFNFIVDLYNKQNGLCALSGIPMTWMQNAGKIRSNISIDRIDSCLDYTEDNIQLVCSIINIMKNNLIQDEFINLCKKVVEVSYAG